LGDCVVWVIWLACAFGPGRWPVVAQAQKTRPSSGPITAQCKLQVRDGVLNAGDYVYEPNGMLHGATTALEDTEYLFICNGPVLFFDDDSFTGYLGWEELQRMRNTNA
ncbi:MAG: hypothetical protein AAF512_20890, partial [Pseudomonadota bacterium]